MGFEVPVMVPLKKQAGTQYLVVWWIGKCVLGEPASSVCRYLPVYKLHNKESYSWSGGI
jgi:hypothetical protein